MVNNGQTEEARDSLAETDIEQLQNDYDSGEELEENDPLFDSGSSFEPLSVLGIQATPSTFRGVIACALSHIDTNETSNSVQSSTQANRKFNYEHNAKRMIKTDQIAAEMLMFL